MGKKVHTLRKLAAIAVCLWMDDECLSRDSGKNLLRLLNDKCASCRRCGVMIKKGPPNYRCMNVPSMGRHCCEKCVRFYKTNEKEFYLYCHKHHVMLNSDKCTGFGAWCGRYITHIRCDDHPKIHRVRCEKHASDLYYMWEIPRDS